MNKLLLAAATVIALGAAGGARADVYVGSWEVDQGPYWNPPPPAYTGQEAAALLFGGSPSEYVISTISDNPADINGEAWVSTWGGACDGGYPCGTVVPDNSVVSTGGYYESPGDQSAYVSDWARGPEYINYAFLVAAPEPASLALVGVGVAALGMVRRKRTR